MADTSAQRQVHPPNRQTDPSTESADIDASLNAPEHSLNDPGHLQEEIPFTVVCPRRRLTSLDQPMSRRIKIGQLQSFHCGLISGGCDGSEIFICHAKYGTLYHPKGRLGLVATLTRTTPIFMGRRAKHLTQAAKACARREIDRKYSQSESGGWRSHPFGRTPMRLTHTFEWTWTRPTPTVFHYFTECLGQIIDGTRMRQQKEDDRRRRVDLTQMGWSAFIDALRVEVMQLLADWEALDIEMYDSYHASRPYEMHQNYLQLAGPYNIPSLLPPIP
ncbi:hypothetical protein B0H14DRAFT_2647184 [Mycena olivaceomarginata]|nr:hypothetical protein B0H14DRAFT_2647184 [Mycena olivaceomarginata]